MQYLVGHTKGLCVGMFEQQGVSGRISSRMSALEGTQNEFRQQMSEVLHTSQQNTLVLNNLSSMFSIVMEKIGNPVSVGEPKSPRNKALNSDVPSVDRSMFSIMMDKLDNPVYVVEPKSPKQKTTNSEVPIVDGAENVVTRSDLNPPF